MIASLRCDILKSCWLALVHARRVKLSERVRNVILIVIVFFSNFIHGWNDQLTKQTYGVFANEYSYSFQGNIHWHFRVASTLS